MPPVSRSGCAARSSKVSASSPTIAICGRSRRAPGSRTCSAACSWPSISPTRSAGSTSSAGTIGLIFAIGSIGFLVGALVSQPLARRLGVGPTIVWSAVLFGPPGLLVPLAPQAAPIPWLVASWWLFSFSGPIYNITQVSLRQAICPHRLLGRMNATMRFLVWGTMPIGAFIGGVLGSLIGLRATLYVAGAGQLISFIPVAFSPVRSIMTVPDLEQDEAASGE